MTGFDCDPCGRYFSQHSHYEDHLIHSFRHHYCKPCQRDFVSEEAKQAHLANSGRHMICPWCETIVGNLRTHNQSNHEQCSVCSEWTADESDLHLHCSWAHSEIYCIPCRRLFSQPDGLENHRRSSAHLEKDQVCPHSECHSAFISKAALVAHFEAGTCASGVDMKIIDRYFDELDNHQRFIMKGLLSPSDRTVPATGRRGDYRCPICPKVFRYPLQLDQHLRAPKHQNNGQKPYRCPSQRCRGAKFSCLSALLQHRERGNCEPRYGEELRKLIIRLLKLVAAL